MSLEQSLLLNRYLHRQFGADSLAELGNELAGVPEGADADGRSFFAKRLLNGPYRYADAEAFERYDARIMELEERLAHARGTFTFKYFQYLALLYTELYLDALTTDPEALASALNAFKADDATLADLADCAPHDLRRMAYFMATGSGKTLLMHAGLWQIQHYLSQGARPDALVSRADGRREFDSIILVTPNEGLSRQHLDELTMSGVDAGLLLEGRGAPGLFRPTVQVIDIHKLRLPEERVGDGTSIPVEELGGANLVFVDEGHKGTGSEAQSWKRKQRALATDGMLVEYSATFAQAIAAASRRDRRTLLNEYGRSILFDYSYGHFYGDGFGKDYSVLNLRRGHAIDAQELLLGGLLVFYQQSRLFREHRAALRRFNIEPPLWVFLGSSVQAEKNEQGRSDVATVIGFLQRFMADRAWAEGVIGRIRESESGFVDEAGNDLFSGRLSHLAATSVADVYEGVCRDLFHGRGEIQVVELKNAAGELALRVSAPGTGESPYFGVINIGDASALKKHLVERLGIEVGEDRFSGSLFDAVDEAGSRINVLVGSRKFIEGWSSWRVAGMGLLNLGKGEGPQVIQLFGRGVRLKGRGWSLKRSSDAVGADDVATGLRELETLNVFGWNADYMQRFLETLGREEMPVDLALSVDVTVDDWGRLPLVRTRDGYSSNVETWTLDADGPRVERDHTARIAVLRGADHQQARVGEPRRLDFSVGSHARDLVKIERAYLDLLEYKLRRGYDNVLIRPDVLLPILERCELTVPVDDADLPDRVQLVVVEALRAYFDGWVRQRRRQAEYAQLELTDLGSVNENVIDAYTIRVRSPDQRAEIERLIADRDELLQTSDQILPRFYLDWHVYNPVLGAPGKQHAGISVRPAGLVKSEQRLVGALHDFWKEKSGEGPFAGMRLSLLRNLSGRGLRFFPRIGFSPDFILWIEDERGTRVQFLEPHGMHHEGLTANEHRFVALRDLARLSDEPQFRGAAVRLGGYVLTETQPGDINDAGDRTRAEIMSAYPQLMWMDVPEFPRRLIEPGD